MQIKTTMRYHIKPVSIFKVKRYQVFASMWRKGNPYDGNVNWYSLYGKQHGDSSNSYPYLKFPASRTLRNKFLFLSCLVFGILLQQPKLTKSLPLTHWNRVRDLSCAQYFCTCLDGLIIERHLNFVEGQLGVSQFGTW